MNSIKKTIYLDHAATTPIDPRVFEEMVPFLKEQYGNASSVHQLGRKARFSVEDARERVAAHIGAAPGEIIFTSGGTEANNLALKGQPSPGRFVSSATEHEAILKQSEGLKRMGWDVTFIQPGKRGSITREQLIDHVDESTRLVSLMHVNNETGAINSVREIGDYLREKGIVFHCDGVQSFGFYDWDMAQAPIDLITGSSHKMYGPKGAGFLYVKAGVDLLGQIEGGSQERRRRGGTENVAAIVGMAKAMDLAVAERDERVSHIQGLKRHLLNGIGEVLPPGTYVMNSGLQPDLWGPHVVNVAFLPLEGIPMDGEMLILNFDMEGICVSSGSACTSGAIEPSHVLLSLGLKPETASAAVRFSLGKDNTYEEIDFTLERLQRIVTRMRGVLHV